MSAECKHVIDEKDVVWQEEKLPSGGSFFRKKLAAAANGVRLGCNLVRIPPRTRSWPLHYHTANEEAVYVLSGGGTLIVSHDRVCLQTGTYVALPPGPEHAHRVENDTDDELVFLCFSTMQQPDVVVYPHSNKVGIFAGGAPGAPAAQQTLKCFLDLDAVVDYWKDES